MADFDFAMFRGNTFSFDVNITQDGDPLDISNSSLTFAARFSYLDRVVFTKTQDQGGGITILDAFNGKARIVIAPADTRELANIAEPLVADLQLIDSCGQIFTVASGTIKVNPVAVPLPIS